MRRWGRYLDFLGTHRTIGKIRSHPEGFRWGGFGDWLALDGSGHVEGGTPARRHRNGVLRARRGDHGARRDHPSREMRMPRPYRVLHAEIVEAFQRRFVTPEGLLASGTQTSYVLALHFNLLPEKVRATAAAELVRDIKRRDYHLATGFVGTPYLLDVLESTGHLDVAYKLLEQETFPSWLFPVKNGATTIWERWDGWTPDKGFQDKGMNSFNHYAYGAVGAWMYKTVAGLDLDAAEPGYRHIVFRPRPGGTITWAEAKLRTPHGDTAIRWDLKDGALHVAMTVPEGCRGTFQPPAGFGGAETPLTPGTHDLVLQAKTRRLGNETRLRTNRPARRAQLGLAGHGHFADATDRAEVRVEIIETGLGSPRAEVFLADNEPPLPGRPALTRPCRQYRGCAAIHRPKRRCRAGSDSWP